MSPDTYYWRVRARDDILPGAWSQARDFTFLELSAPTLTAPVDEAFLTDDTPEFSWGAVTGAAEYQIQIATDSGFTAIVDDVVQAGLTYAPVALDFGDTYYWRVRAITNEIESAWSSARSFDLHSFITYVEQIFAPIGWWHALDIDGSDLPNRGSAGAVLDAVVGNVVATGKALDFNGTNSFIDIPNDASLSALSTYTIIQILAPDTAGEVSFGRFHQWATESMTFNGAFTAIRSTEDADGTDANTVIPAAGLTAGQRILVARTYDDTGLLTGDRRIRIYKGVDGVLAEFAYTTHVAATGTWLAKTGTLNIGCNPARDRTFDGLWYSAFWVADIVSTEELTNLTTAADAFFQ